jgi:hypothetical protein
MADRKQDVTVGRERGGKGGTSASCTAALVELADAGVHG